MDIEPTRALPRLLDDLPIRVFLSDGTRFALLSREATLWLIVEFVRADPRYSWAVFPPLTPVLPVWEEALEEVDSPSATVGSIVRATVERLHRAGVLVHAEDLPAGADGGGDKEGDFDAWAVQDVVEAHLRAAAQAEHWFEA